MSIVKTEQILCTNCQKSSNYHIWSSININEDIHLFNDIMDQKLFQWRCPYCEEYYHIYYPCLYHDIQKKFMVYFLPHGYQEVQKELNEFKVSTVFQLYTMRLCNDIFAFREKIKVLTSNINDKGIEIMKLVLLQKFINEDKDSVMNIYYHDEYQDQYIFILTGKDNSTETISVVKDAYKDILSGVTYIDFNITEGEFLNIDINWAVKQLNKS
ncbi:MAG: CpXC domain-containing protein [Eubacteriales bacterium]